MNPTHRMLCAVQRQMYELLRWRCGPPAKYRRQRRRLERIEAYLIARMGR